MLCFESLLATLDILIIFKIKKISMIETVHLFKIRGAKTIVFFVLRFWNFEARMLFCLRSLVSHNFSHSCELSRNHKSFDLEIKVWTKIYPNFDLPRSKPL